MSKTFLPDVIEYQDYWHHPLNEIEDIDVYDEHTLLSRNGDTYIKRRIDIYSNAQFKNSDGKRIQNASVNYSIPVNSYGAFLWFLNNNIDYLDLIFNASIDDYYKESLALPVFKLTLKSGEEKIGFFDMLVNHSNHGISIKEVNFKSPDLKQECERLDNVHHYNFNEIEDISLFAGILTWNESYLYFDEPYPIHNWFGVTL